MTTEVLQAKPDITHPDTGIEQQDRKRLANGLRGVLADTYLLLVKTHGYHWNVVGPLFVSIHKLTEEHYENMFEAIDDLAERIRALGHPAPTSFAQMIAQSQLDEESGAPAAAGMIRTLIDDHGKIVRRLRETAAIAAEMQDDVTNDLLTERMAFHEKAIWMLEALVAE